MSWSVATNVINGDDATFIVDSGTEEGRRGSNFSLVKESVQDKDMNGELIDCDDDDPPWYYYGLTLSRGER